MIKLALFVTLEVIPGKQEELEQFLGVGRILAEQEQGTITWYAFKLGPTAYGIFDTFKKEEDRQGHLSGGIARTLMKIAPELLASPPDIQQADVIAAK